MIEVVLFCEDRGHEDVVGPIVKRVADERGLAARLGVRARADLRRYLTDLDRAHVASPDLLVIARDANCKGYAPTRRALESVAGERGWHTVYAIPDPHVEKWLMLDSQAFSEVLGRGCSVPKSKCDKDAYKRLLAEAVVAAGQRPLVHGLEYAPDIIDAMDLDAAGRHDKGLGQLLTDLRSRLAQIERGS